MEMTLGDSADLSEAIDKFRKALAADKIFIRDEERDASIHFCIKHHTAHLIYLKVDQVRVDPYKVVTWFAFDLARCSMDHDEPEMAKRIISVAVATLCSFLRKERPAGMPFGALTIAYIRNLSFNEVNGLTEHGVGKNGLFAAFHCSVKAKQSMK